MITNHPDRPLNNSWGKWIEEKNFRRLHKFAFLIIYLQHIWGMLNFLWNHSFWFPPLPQLQQATSNHSKTCPEGTREENESSKYRQWPLQTPSMINVKGFLFLICQSFQRSLTYAYFQPQRSHHSSRWSGTSKPITARLCWGCCCQSCKLAHLQPFIMHCSKEQLVFLREGWRSTM